MKVLSLKQPFAELILQGRKTIELRKWNTGFRGDFLIHASKVPDKKAMKAFGFSELPTGKIVGRAHLFDVKEYLSDEEFYRDGDKHLASKKWGNFGFVLIDVARVKSVPCLGRLGFWDFEYRES